jgi:hypothetical protein
MYTVYAQKYENKQKEWHHATKPLKDCELYFFGPKGNYCMLLFKQHLTLLVLCWKGKGSEFCLLWPVISRDTAPVTDFAKRKNNFLEKS